MAMMRLGCQVKTTLGHGPLHSKVKCPRSPQRFVASAQRRPAYGNFVNFDDEDTDWVANPLDPPGIFLPNFPDRGPRKTQREPLADFQGPPPRVREKDPEPVERFVNGKALVVNEEIQAKEVRLVGPEKEQMGIMKYDAALRMAKEYEVDLVLLDSTQNPPICRLIAWSKYKYEVEKLEKEKRSGSAVQAIKEVRMRPKTDDNDMQVKLRSAQKFLQKGNKVKLTMKFEGRELQFRDQGKELLLKFIAGVGDVGKVDGPLNFKTGTYTVVLTPMKG